MSTSVDFAFRNERVLENTLPNLPSLFDMLRERDLSPVVSLGGEHAFDPEGIHTFGYTRSREMLGEKVIAWQALGLIVNVMNRSVIRHMIPDDVDFCTLINENKTRSLGHRKHLMHREVLEPLGLGIPTSLVESQDTLDIFLRDHQASHAIVKPHNGISGIGVQKVEREELKKLFVTSPQLYGEQIVQPAYDFSHPFPAQIKPFSRADSEAFDGWNNASVPKELRMYVFRDPNGSAVFPVGRALTPSDEWFFVDPESVSAELEEESKKIAARISDVTESQTLYAALDHGYGTDGEGDPSWKLIEANVKLPYMLGYDKHVEVATKLRELFSEQIHTVATAKEYQV